VILSAAVVATAVVATTAAGVIVTQTIVGHGASTRTDRVPRGAANIMTAIQAPLVRPSAGASGSATPTGSATPATTLSPSRKPSPTPTKRPAPPAAGGSEIDQLLDQINGLRAKHGLPPYTLLAGLDASAHAHNVRMMGGCGLSHQCSGEASLGDRISAQGVRWSACGENIGWSGPHPNTTTAIVAAAEALTQSMYDETPPNDGHRLNILSSSFHHIGIDVQRDSSGNVWLTQDFSN